MALRYQADTQTKPLGANANTPLQGNTAFKDGQLAEVILLITGRFTVGEGYNGIHKLFQQLRHRFAVEQLSGIKVDRSQWIPPRRRLFANRPGPGRISSTIFVR